MRVRKKLCARSGVTLSEMLVAMAVLGLVTAAIATGMTAGLKVYRASTDLSQSQILLSTLAQSVSDELRYARDIRPGAGTVLYTSPVYGPDASLTVNSGGQVSVSSGGKLSSLLGSGSYAGYRADVSVSYLDGCFSVMLDISAEDGGDSLQSRTITVRALNPKE